MEEQIREFLSAHPQTKPASIDTLQKVRRSIPDAPPYANDCSDLSGLKSTELTKILTKLNAYILNELIEK